MQIFECVNKLPNEIPGAVVLGAGFRRPGYFDDIELTERSKTRALMASPWFDGAHTENTVIFSGGYTAGTIASEAGMMYQAALSHAPQTLRCSSQNNIPPRVELEEESN